MVRLSAPKSAARFFSSWRSRCRLSASPPERRALNELRALVPAELQTPVDPGSRTWRSPLPPSMAKRASGALLRLLPAPAELDGLMLDSTDRVRISRGLRQKLAGARQLPDSAQCFYLRRTGAAKYAVLSEADFTHECGPDAWTVSTRRALSAIAAGLERGRKSARACHPAVSEAAPALLDWTLPVASDVSPTDLWKHAFALTFA